MVDNSWILTEMLRCEWLTISNKKNMIGKKEVLSLATKDTLLALLDSRKGTYCSGEEIGALLNISRTAVWKAIKALQAEGYRIDAVRNKGYRLAQQTDILSKEGLGKHLSDACGGLKIEVLSSAPSTNQLLRERANAGAQEGCTIIANHQSCGRGRAGREFFSPSDTGLYMSLLLRPAGYSPAQAVSITTMAAVAACEAIEAVSGKSPGIKWVNDIFLNSRKVCGILTEGAFDLESGSLEYAILGIGMNVYLPAEGFPAEIAQIAGAIFSEVQSDGKNRLAAEFLNRFFRLYGTNDSTSHAEAYRARSMVLGKEITVFTPKGQRNAVALDVDRDCRLIVRYGDGTVDTLSSAEVSIRQL